MALLKTANTYLKILYGYLVFLLTDDTPEQSYYALRKLFFDTNARFNQSFTNFYNFLFKKYKLSKYSKSLFLPSSEAIAGEGKNYSGIVQKKGYAVLNQTIPLDVCEKINQFAFSTKAMRRSDPSIVEMIDPSEPADFIYDFNSKTMLDSPEIKNLVFDPLFLAIAQEYLGPSCILQNVSMWWSTSKFKNINRDKAAQLYHIDLDVIRWVNFFIYLSDVNEKNGPHCFVEGSHVERVSSVFYDGRYSDEQVAAAYTEQRMKKLTGKAGTILAVDTSGLHKGGDLIEGDRLVLQLRFAISRFGKPGEKISHPSFNSPVNLKNFPFNRIYGDYIKT